MFVDESSVDFKAKGVKSWPTCIYNAINKNFNILINEFLKHLPLSHNVDRKIEVVLGPTPPFKLSYQLNKKELQYFKAQINDLMEWGYIKLNKLF
jgi:hypothetical protein